MAKRALAPAPTLKAQLKKTIGIKVRLQTRQGKEFAGTTRFVGDDYIIVTNSNNEDWAVMFDDIYATFLQGF